MQGDQPSSPDRNLTPMLQNHDNSGRKLNNLDTMPAAQSAPRISTLQTTTAQTAAVEESANEFGPLPPVKPEPDWENYFNPDRAINSILELFKNLERAIEALPSEISLQLTQRYNQELVFRGEQGERTSRFFWSVTGVLRLLTLMVESYHSLKALPSLIPPFRDQLSDEQALRNLFLNTSRRLAASPLLSSTVSKLIPPALLVLRGAPLDDSMEVDEKNRLLAHICLSAFTNSEPVDFQYEARKSKNASLQDFISPKTDESTKKTTRS